MRQPSAGAEGRGRRESSAPEVLFTGGKKAQTNNPMKPTAGPDPAREERPRLRHPALAPLVAALPSPTAPDGGRGAACFAGRGKKK